MIVVGTARVSWLALLVFEVWVHHRCVIGSEIRVDVEALVEGGGLGSITMNRWRLTILQLRTRLCDWISQIILLLNALLKIDFHIIKIPIMGLLQRLSKSRRQQRVLLA